MLHGPCEPAATAPRLVIIVARDRPELQGYFEQAFAGMPEVKIIRDRRVSEHDPAGQGAGAGRRQSPGLDEELSLRGFVITRIW